MNTIQVNRQTVNRQVKYPQQKVLSLKEHQWILQLEKQKSHQTKQQLQQEKQQLEYAYLRSQINPHTLHNILNFFYAKSIKTGCEELSNGIMLLSELMRYSLEAETDENGRVPLSKEIRQLQNTIKMGQLRANNSLHIQLNIEGDVENKTIIPLLLVPFIENGFKYALLNDPHYPMQVRIVVKNNSFQFYQHNKKAKRQYYCTSSHGIGQSNTKKRMSAAYGIDGYSMEVAEEDDYYTLRLVITNLNTKPRRLYQLPVASLKN